MKLVRFVSVLVVFVLFGFGQLSGETSIIEGITNIPGEKHTGIAGEDLDGSYKVQASHILIPSIDASLLPDPDDPTSGNINPFTGEPLPVKEKNEGDPADGEVLWSTDILVSSVTAGSGQDFDADDQTHYLFVTVDTDHSTQDSVYVYISKDGGLTWDIFLNSYNYDGRVENPKVRVARDENGDLWICSMAIWVDSPDDRKLYLRRMKIDSTQNYWELVADTVYYYDMDADIGDSAYLYVTYIPDTSNSVYAARNHLDGSGWTEQTALFVTPETDPEPAIAAGVDGQVGVVFIDQRLAGDHEEIRLKRSTTHGASWIGSQQVSNNSAQFSLSYPDIAFARRSSNNPGWIVATFGGTSNGDNVAYYYSQDAGTSWTYGGTIGQSSDAENMPTLRSSKTYGSVTVAYNQDPGDSTMFSWSSYSDPSSFTTPVKVNDYDATGFWPPTAGWLHNGYSWYSAVLYAAWREGYAIYLDWYSNDGVEEDDIDGNIRFISVTGTYANPGIVYRVITPGRVKITLHDVSGRLVSKLVEGEKRSGTYTVELDNGLSSGVYFVKMSSQDGTFAQKVNVLQ